MDVQKVCFPLLHIQQVSPVLQHIQSSLGRCGVPSFLTYLCEHQARLAHYLTGLQDGLEAVGRGRQLVCWYDGDGLGHGVHRAVKLLPPGLLHLLWSPAHAVLQSLS